MKNRLLTDFDNDLYKHIDIDSLNELILQLNTRYVIGGIGNNSKSSAHAAFNLSNFELKDNKIFGDIRFWDNDLGKISKELIENHNGFFAIRMTVSYTPTGFYITHIYTWDIVPLTKEWLTA